MHAPCIPHALRCQVLQQLHYTRASISVCQYYTIPKVSEHQVSLSASQLGPQSMQKSKINTSMMVSHNHHLMGFVCPTSHYKATFSALAYGGVTCRSNGHACGAKGGCSPPKPGGPTPSGGGGPSGAPGPWPPAALSACSELSMSAASAMSASPPPAPIAAKPPDTCAAAASAGAGAGRRASAAGVGPLDSGLRACGGASCCTATEVSWGYCAISDHGKLEHQHQEC